MVSGILHQVHAGSSRHSLEKSLPQPLVERLRVGKEERLAHTANGLIEIGAQRQPNQYEICAARFLLKPGRSYEGAVKTFQPYDKVKEPNPEVCEAGRALIARGKSRQSSPRDFHLCEQPFGGQRA
jgi:hypothetical protein